MSEYLVESWAVFIFDKSSGCELSCAVMLLENGMNICRKNCTEMESNALSLIRKRRKRQRECVVLRVALFNIATVMYTALQSLRATVSQINHMQYERKDKKRHRVESLAMLIRESDVMCKKELRMDRKTFSVLCEMVRDIGGLRGTRNMPLEEIVAMFLYTLAHNKNNRSVASYFSRSGESVSRHFNRCLLAVLKLHRDLMVKRPTPMTEDCEDDTWRCFKNCLGALDGTYIKVRVGNEDRPRYRTKNGNLAMNVLGVCTPNMEFVFVSPGWEGSADDDRVLQDAISRTNGLKVPQGCYYLVDAEYTNCEGFLAPYRGHRYHLKEWSGWPPMSAEECFNMKHAKARNVIRRCFGLLKGRWAVLRSPSFFPIRTQGRIVHACVILHNLIRKLMPTDDMVYDGDEDAEDGDDNDGYDDDEVEFITYAQSSDSWTTFRDILAQTSFNEWRARSSRAT